jgi:hypothetical protein
MTMSTQEPPAVGRREVLAGAALALSPGLAEAAGKARPRRAAPPGFLWGTAISAYQSEGGNTNSDAWLMENLQPSMFKDRSGDACDSYHRYAEDFAIAGGLGFNCYRMGVEWARIEPSEGAFSEAELDHYARMLEACRARGLKPHGDAEPFHDAAVVRQARRLRGPRRAGDLRPLLPQGRRAAGRTDGPGHDVQRGQHPAAGRPDARASRPRSRRSRRPSPPPPRPPTRRASRAWPMPIRRS